MDSKLEKEKICSELQPRLKELINNLKAGQIESNVTWDGQSVLVSSPCRALWGLGVKTRSQQIWSVEDVEEAVEERGLAAVVGTGGPGAVIPMIFECSAIWHI